MDSMYTPTHKMATLSWKKRSYRHTYTQKGRCSVTEKRESMFEGFLDYFKSKSILKKTLKFIFAIQK